MLARALLFLGIALLLFLPFTILTVRQLVRIHPRRRRVIYTLAILGNLLWPFLLFLNRSAGWMRGVRATLGPLWFGWTSFALLYSILLFLVLLAWIPFRRTPFAQFARWPSRVFLATVLIGFVAGYYQAIVPLRVERVPVAIDNLAPGLEGKRIALLGDLHVGLFTRRSRLDRIFATTDALRPDVVLIAGDLIDDDPFFVPKLIEGTRRLSPATPLFAVLGNHEMYGNPRRVIDGLRGSRIRLLVNEGAAHGGLWIGGISDFAATDVPGAQALKPDLTKALASMPRGSLPVVLAHQPKVFAEVRKRNLPLALSAHTHGGQLGFRPLRLSLAGLFLPYHMGLYREGASQLYINTGTGYWLFPFRLGMTPEITLIELRRR
jgi:predicted MPP superfamily phosphohydrolase